MSGAPLIGGLFGGSGGTYTPQAPSVPQISAPAALPQLTIGNPATVTPMMPPSLVMPFLQPTAVPPPPDRSDADVQAAAAAQRRAFGFGGGRPQTNVTGAGGVPQSARYSAVTNLLGGTA